MQGEVRPIMRRHAVVSPLEVELPWQLSAKPVKGNGQLDLASTKGYRERLTVKLLPEEGDVYVLTRSGDRVQKERAIRNRKLKRLWRRLNEVAAMKRQTCEQLLMRLGAAKQEAGRFWRLVRVETEPFSFALDRAALRQARGREGLYVLRSNLPAGDPAALWRMYMRLGEVEQAFKELKNDLGLRPIHHQLERRIEAHIFVAFMAYCLQVTLKNLLRHHAGGLNEELIERGPAAERDLLRQLRVPEDLHDRARQDQVLLDLRVVLPRGRRTPGGDVGLLDHGSTSSGVMTKRYSFSCRMR